MDFVCDFNELNFCHYSNLGWGFQKSVIYSHEVKPISNLPSVANYFPCTVSNNIKTVSKLEKEIAVNSSQSLCLQFSYMLEDNGHITVTNGKSKWSTNASLPFSQWNSMRFPINNHLSDSSADSMTLKITGQSLCVDNFTLSAQPCPLTPTVFETNFSSNHTFWLTQPFSVLVAIVTVLVLFTLLGIVSSILCAKRSQHTLRRSKQLSRKFKRYSFDNSVENGTIVDSCCDIDTIGSSRFFAHHNRFLPPLVANGRCSAQLMRYSRQSFLASSSVETNDSTPHYRFSLALTEDAQVQLLNNSNSASPPVTGQLSLVRQHTILTAFSHESTPCSNEIDNINHPPNSIVTVPSLCAPILNRSESDLSLGSAVFVEPMIIEQSPVRCDRYRPIRETMNDGYVSDTSLCDLPQYDMAVKLLVDQRTNCDQSSDVDDIIEDFNGIIEEQITEEHI